LLDFFIRIVNFFIRELEYLVESNFSFREIALRKKLKNKKIHYSRYKLFKKKWLLDSDINTIIDIGANVGEFTCIFVELFPNATIFAFEPIDDCYNELIKRTENYSKVNQYNFGLGAENTIKNFFKSSWDPSSSFLEMSDLHKKNAPHSAKSTILEIEIKRLDDVVNISDLRNNILIKIDVQGFEAKVIQGGKKVFQKAKVIIIETSFITLYEKEPKFHGIYELLKNLGFEFRGILKQSFFNQDDSILYADCIFVSTKDR